MTNIHEKNLAAVIEEKGARFKIVEREIPKPGPNELVVRNYAIAANPVDWKIQDYGFAVTKYPNVLGSDGCGVVTAIGSSVTKFHIGDRVTGFAAVIGNSNPDHGAWQTYEVLQEIATTKIPDFLSFEQGATIPMAFATAAMAFYGVQDLPRPGASAQQLKEGLLIWGAASSVGTAAIQLATNSGYKVFATASPAHHEYLKSLGAAEVFDYKDPEVVSKIVAAAKAAGTPITIAYDTVSEGTTFELTAETLLAFGGSKMVMNLPWSGKDGPPQGIELLHPTAFYALTERSEIGEWLFNEYLPKALADRTVVPSPKIEIVDGGLAAAQKALDQLKAGVSGKKLVVKVDQHVD